MKLSFIGLGYVGLVSSICLGSRNHTIYGYDKDAKKIDSLKDKELYIDENQLDSLFQSSKNLNFSTGIDNNLYNSDLVFVCVDTPYDDCNILNLSNLFAAVEDIANKKRDSKRLNVVIRSTIPPHTIKKLSKKYAEQNISFTSNPEFLREGNAVSDFFNAHITVIGSEDQNAIDKCLELYNEFESEKIITKPENAEMIKFVNNSFHALKIVFANEIGQICNANEISSKELMSIFKSDTQLNISDKYFNPGFSFGGSCLPKDTNGLINLAKDSSINVRLLPSIIESNKLLISRIANQINQSSLNNILIAGITFKEGTDDLRGSPILELIDQLTVNTFYFMDDKISKHEINFNGKKLINLNQNLDEKNFDLLIYNYGEFSQRLSDFIDQCELIFDLNNKLEKKENIIQIT
jgi:GDP-mannose 6-dehydrogenase